MATPVPDTDVAEQRRSALGEDPPDTELAEVGEDVPVADAVEQSAAVAPGGGAPGRADVPFEADAADAAEQSVPVPLDDDEARD